MTSVMPTRCSNMSNSIRPIRTIPITSAIGASSSSATSRPREERQAEAEQIWRRLLAARPTDPLVATQVADLFRNADMQPQALALYQKAVELAADLAAVPRISGRVLSHPASGPRRRWRPGGKWPTAISGRPANVARLAEVLAQFGYLKEALPEIAAACELDPKDFALRSKGGRLADSRREIRHGARLAKPG